MAPAPRSFRSSRRRWPESGGGSRLRSWLHRLLRQKAPHLLSNPQDIVDERAGKAGHEPIRERPPGGLQVVSRFIQSSAGDKQPRSQTNLAPENVLIARGMDLEERLICTPD